MNSNGTNKIILTRAVIKFAQVPYETEYMVFAHVSWHITYTSVSSYFNAGNYPLIDENLINYCYITHTVRN